MSKKFKVPYFVQDIIPPLLGIIFSLIYFTSVLRGYGPYVKGLTILAGILLILSRFPKVWYFKKYLIPPIAEYKKAKSQGRTLSSKKLADLYIHLASFVTRSQILNALLWIFAETALVICDRIFLIGTDRRSGIETVRDGNDARDERDLVSRKAVGVSFPVQLLVVKMRSRDYVSQLRDVFQQFVPSNGVRLHHLVFALG